VKLALSLAEVHDGLLMRTFKVLEDFRRLVNAIQGLVAVLLELVKIQQEAGPALDRVTALELSRHQFEAECAGALLEAKGKQKGALSSEARERHMRKQNERDAGAFPPDGAEITEDGTVVLADDAPAIEAERVHAMRLVVAPSPKAAALSFKYGR